MKELFKIIDNFKKKKILVIGDVLLDKFIWGEVSRISPEAPIPIVKVTKESYMPGGAGNVANNIASLGGIAFLCGVIGQDEDAQILKKELSKNSINYNGLIIDSSRPTIVKTRIIAHNQQIVRFDKEKVENVNHSIQKKILEYIISLIKEVDGVIIEDYGKGIITQNLLKNVLSLCKANKKIITVDPKINYFNYYKEVDTITPNQSEAEQITGIKIIDEKSLYKVGEKILKKLNCQSVLITRGDKGMVLFEKNGSITSVSTMAQEVYDVSGAGDTVISCFTLALVSGADKKQATYISNYAAGVVVGKLGVATVNKEEIKKNILEYKLRISQFV
ncbi:MAG: D-glycero-beta-D-manno-heptose-7-phosphate kinase [bacterium]